MSTVTIHADPSPPKVMRPVTLCVYVDGERRRDLHVDHWVMLPAPEFGRARVTLAMASRLGSDHRLEDIAALPPVGSRLQIFLAEPDRAPLFDGYVAEHLGRVGPDTEQLALEAEDVLLARLSSPIAGRWRVNDVLPVFVPNEQCVFNDESEGLASPATHAVNWRQCRIFQSAPEGQLWSVADILGYLLAAYRPADLWLPQVTELHALAGTIYPRRFSVTGLSAAEAIARAAGLGGLQVRGSIASANGAVQRGLVFYRPGRTGRRRAIRLQKHGEALDVPRSNLWKGKLILRRRPSRPGALVLGDLKQYESTFQLKRGWDPSLESYEHRSFIRSEASDWLAVRGVFRKWVLNESGQYCGQPYDLERFDFSNISAEDFFLSAPRRFKPCLSVGSAARSLGIVVEVSYDDGSHWKRYGGPVRVSTDECAVYVADDALPADYFQAGVEHLLKLRVTATVVSDRRISAQAGGDPGCGVEVLEIPRARWAKVHSGSIFFGSEELPPPIERDDTPRLIQLARSLSQSRSGAVEADLTLGWLDPTCTVGDIIERVEGRQLGLVPFPGACPHVQAVEHRCGEDWTTHLTVSG